MSFVFSAVKVLVSAPESQSGILAEQEPLIFASEGRNYGMVGSNVCLQAGNFPTIFFERIFKRSEIVTNIIKIH